MLACIPTKGNAGLEDTVFDHFGSAPYFTLYDTDKSSVTVLENRNAHHSHGTCHPMNQLAAYHVDCVICAGMGRRAIEALNAEGIKIYQSGRETVRELVEKVKAGQLAEMDPLRACRGHGQHHGEDYVHQPGRGAGFGQGSAGGFGQGRGGGFGQGRGGNRGGR